MATAESLSTRAIDAWVSDTEEIIATEWEFNQPPLDPEIISLACVWSLAKAKFSKELVTCFNFAQEVMAHDAAREAWRRRAEKAGQPEVDIKEFDFAHLLVINQAAGAYMPQRFTAIALTEGRTQQDGTISGIEASLLSALGNAVYNCDAAQLIWLKPLGPPPSSHPDTYAWLNQADQHVLDFSRFELRLPPDRFE